jgi:hypothetical protein
VARALVPGFQSLTAGHSPDTLHHARERGMPLGNGSEPLPQLAVGYTSKHLVAAFAAHAKALHQAIVVDEEGSHAERFRLCLHADLHNVQRRH